MNREIEFRMWNCVKGNPSASRMFYGTTEVMECLKQQMLFDSGNKVLGYDHVGDGNVFMQYLGRIDMFGEKVYEDDLFKCQNGKTWRIEYDEAKSEYLASNAERRVEGTPLRNLEVAQVIGNIHESGGGEG